MALISERPGQPRTQSTGGSHGGPVQEQSNPQAGLGGPIRPPLNSEIAHAGQPCIFPFFLPVSRALKSTLLIGVQVSLLLVLIQLPRLLLPLDAAVSRVLGVGGANAPQPVWQSLVFTALALGVAWTTIVINRPPFKVLVAAVAAAEILTLSGLVALYGVYFSPILPAAAVVMAFAAAFVYSRSETGQRQRLADATFGRRISAEQMRAVVEDRRVPLDDAGSLQEVTLVAVEILNHEALLDGLEPTRHAAVSNRYLHAAAEVLVAGGGTLAACDGEGVRAVFGAPLPAAEHALQACRAALELVRRVRALDAELSGEHAGLACDVRVGINSGDMAVGYFGAERLGGYGAAGEEVSFTRRLCAANLVYGTTILIGARTFELAEAAVEARPLELLRRRQGDAFLEVYELLGEPQDLSAEELSRRDLYWTGVIFFREKRLADAMEKFVQARPAEGRADGPLDFYVNRIRQLQNGKGSADYETTRLLNTL